MPESSLPKIGRFQVVKALGRGGQGAVYLAHDPGLDRLVAIKVVGSAPGFSGEEDGSPQARNLAQLRHPNIIALYEAGRFHGLSFFVFEHLEGDTLYREIDCGVLGPDAACSTMLQVVDAMAYAHGKGILHLDLSPANVMRDAEGKPRVMDFDLSRAVGPSNRPSPHLSGTLPYMAPECVDSGEVDARTDVYALGLVFYEVLTGRRAAPALSEPSMLRWIATGEPDLGKLRGIDPEGELATVIAKATRKQPSERYADAAQMRTALRQAWDRWRMSRDETQLLHGTLAFVLKRIERRGEFPAISRTLADVNHLTSDDNQSPLSRLATVVLRDYALTSRLLKIANSAAYARVSGNVKTVTEAINLLGVNQVRQICNGLACFSHFGQRESDRRLREGSIAAFISGLIARHLAVMLRHQDPEEAFLAGMLLDLGGMLALFYFPEEFGEMNELVSAGASMEEASRTVLGVSLPQLGAAVGRIWCLPEAVLECMSPTLEQDRSRRRLRALAQVANLLATADPTDDPDHLVLLDAAQALRPEITLEVEDLSRLLAAALDKFRAFAPVLEVDADRSETVKRAEAWMERVRLQAEAGRAAADGTGTDALTTGDTGAAWEAWSNRAVPEAAMTRISV
jgi:serine/threonine protein kinase